MADPFAQQPSLAREFDLPGAHHTDVERSAAGIDDDDVIAFTFRFGIGDARQGRHGRPRFYRVDRFLDHVLHMHNAAGARAHQDFTLIVGGAQIALEFSKMALHERLQRGVDGGGGGAGILADDRVELMRQRIGNARQDLGDQLAKALFMCRIGDRPEQAHGDGLDIHFCQAGDGGPSGRFVQRRLDAALSIDALGNFKGEAARHVGRRKLNHNIERLALAALAVKQNVGEAFGHQQGGLGGFFLDDGIGRARGTVNQNLGLAQEIRHRHIDDLRRIGQRSGKALIAAIGRGQCLADHQMALGIRDNNIGEGAAGIDGNAIAHSCALEFFLVERDCHVLWRCPMTWSWNSILREMRAPIKSSSASSAISSL